MTHLCKISVLVLGLLLTSRASAQPTPPTLESRWGDLTSTDEAKATRAMLALAAAPKETISLLKEKLKPVKVDAARVAKLIAQLESTNFVIRNQAMAELEYLDKYIKPDLEKAHKKATDAETKSRIQRLLDRFPKEQKAAPQPPAPKLGGGRSISVTTINGQVQIMIDGVPINMAQMATPPTLPPGPPVQWVRAVRAITILEHLGSAEAQQMLQAIASGEADAMPTIAARDALNRLKKAE